MDRPSKLTESASIAQTARMLLKELKTPEAARAFLIKHGFLTPAGRIPKKYGG